VNRISTINHSFIVSLTLLAITILAAAGCAGITGSPEVAASNSEAADFKVAVLLPDEEDDKGWSQSGYEGLKLIEKELGATVAFTPEASPEEAKAIASQYADDGYNFIIGHGNEYIPAFKVVAERYPRTKFAVSAPYTGNNKNFGGLAFRDDELGYLAGVVAAQKSQSQKIVFIGGESFPNLVDLAKAYERGAKSIDPSTEVTIEWVGNWVDQDRAREITQAHIDAGADIFAVNADVAGLAVHELASNTPGVYSIGWVLDQHELAPETIITSGMQSVPKTYLEATILVRQGRWEGKLYRFGLQEGAHQLAPFYGLLTPEQEEQVNAVQAGIMTGDIDVSSP